MTSEIKPGLLVLHGNRLELLRDAVLDWLSRNPLEPLEEEIFLVQSNGAAEWLKMSLASAGGICASTRVELPARFLWRLYRHVLGREAVPSQSPLDKDALTWRLMRVLPERAGEAWFGPMASFLQGDDPDRRLQLAQRLADLFDQYQIYRADWLDAWAAGRDTFAGPSGKEDPLPADQRWQAMLWRDVLADLDAGERRAIRPQVHRDMVAALDAGAAIAEPLPRRVVLFGASHSPGQMLDALVALSRHSQVLVAIPNPCRFHWADIIDGREFLRAARQRHPSRGLDDLAAIPLEAMHGHAHPLLAAWGRQGRDFMRQLDAYDDPARTRKEFDLPRIDLFDEGNGTTLLEQVQAAIRDLVPLAEHAQREVGAGDRSIVFHVGHGAQREVEILHDQLLRLFAAGDDGPALRPRDVVVMVPDVETFAPAIRAVFGQYPRGDARCIPFDISDLLSRDSNPLVVALDWLLRLPAQRFRIAEIRDLLDVPAIAQRLGLQPEDRPRLAQWIVGSGVRWGLNVDQRAQLGLGACGEQNSWSFGLRRMLLGYASGDGESYSGIAPYDEIGGLEAAVVGVLADLLDRLQSWWRLAGGAATPADWVARGRELIAALIDPTDESERHTAAAMQDVLSAWLDACDRAGFDEAVPLSVFREAWLGGIDAPGGGGRFLAGGVTFCTLMPLRAIPFEMVCLLGMNDGDYPRQGQRSDFDLMRLPGQYRPGDRSRRDDDRYLMLEALLSARRTLYVSWSGRSTRDNTEQPPSVLVAQLRDYLAAGWSGEGGGDVLDQRTTRHPLQPFSRRYFEGGALFTYAREWRAAHLEATSPATPMPAFDDAGVELGMRQIERFLKNPVKEFFRARLDVMFADDDPVAEDDEAFDLDGLKTHGLVSALLDDPQTAVRQGLELAVARRLERIRGAGLLPMGELGVRAAGALEQMVLPLLTRWSELQSRYAQDAPKQPLRFESDGVVFGDWLDGLRADGDRQVWIALSASRLTRGGEIRPDKLIGAWVRMLCAGACGHPAAGWLIGPDATVHLPAIEPDAAAGHLRDVLAAWRAGMQAPLPFAARTALAWVKEGDAARAYEGGFNSPFKEVDEPCLARIYPDFDVLSADGRFAHYASRLFAPLDEWARSEVELTVHTVGRDTVAEDARDE